MGFNPFTEGVIDFEGTRFAGAKVRVRLDIPLGKLQEFERLSLKDGALLEDEFNWIRDNALIDWDIESKDGPVPVTAPMSDLPRSFVRYLVSAWYRAANEIDGPLVETSADGDTSEEQ